jgi:hypothetical protein
MIDWDKLLFWVVVTSPYWGVFLWETWSSFLRPALIPQVRIDAICAALVAKYGPDAEYKAYTEECQAWYDDESFEQGMWRRVRKTLRRSRTRSAAN